MSSEFRPAAPPCALLLPTTGSDDAPQQPERDAACGKSETGARLVEGGTTPNTANVHGADYQATTTSAFDAVCATATSTLDAPPLALASAHHHRPRPTAHSTS